MIRTFTAKLGRMRKPDNWVVYPRKTGEKLVVQAGAYICSFDAETGEGMLSKRQSGGAYFMHLSEAFGAKPVKVPQEVINAALTVEPGAGPVRVVG